MDRFEAMQRFLLVAQYGSFTRASEALDLPKSSISSSVQFLERKLGTWGHGYFIAAPVESR
ncbi:LysR family transcriptional regulator [Leucothrix mucor]|uniref:LysR family transcriptional regulator n=1 Tax=Leucothrix mucor TaxID=45248 RepID=UPI00042005AF|nr:LysR family transcriptional regulator [Leucothrix mucor]